METTLVDEVGRQLTEGYLAYLAEFRAITARAKTRFANQDWHGIQADHKRRLNLYKQQVAKIARQVKRTLQATFHDEALWCQLKELYRAFSELQPSTEIAQTFYNSICRKVLNDIGADDRFMFVRSDPSALGAPEPLVKRYKWTQKSEDVIRQVLLDFRMEAPYENLQRDVNLIVAGMKEEFFHTDPPNGFTYLEFLPAVFYRNKGAYLVGRFSHQHQYFPFVLPMLNEGNGVYIDTMVSDENEVSIIFSFTRSYFLVELDAPSRWVSFLKTLMPLKPYSEIYNAIGFNKHGKTELYRDFLRHLSKSKDEFIIAPGIRGMVMAVFVLPSYHIVFKLIKDRFDPPKQTSAAHVRSCYKLVSVHDRVGRMADTHEFEYFSFPRARFSEELLQHLQQVAPSLLTVTDDEIIISHLYTERKMIPLNMFLEIATPSEIDEVVEEYGNTIKQLAAANIFPGDMLLKNFGVTRHRRVVFYDYDEIGFLTDYHFRRMPEPAEGDDYLASTPWFAVGPNDVFPEEFRQFLIGDERIRKRFFELHADLFEPRYWIQMQQRIKAGEVVDVFPYRRRKRFKSHGEAPDLGATL